MFINLLRRGLWKRKLISGFYHYNNASKTRSGKSPKKAAYVSVILEAPLRNKRLRKLVGIEEEEEEEEESVSLIRKKKDADASFQKETIEPTLKVAQLLPSVILE